MTDAKVVDGYNVIEYAKSNIYVIENIIDDAMCDELKTVLNKVNLVHQEYRPGNNVPCYSTSLNTLLNTNDSHYYLFPTNAEKYKTQLYKVKTKQSLTTNRLDGLSNKYILSLKDFFKNKISNIKNIFKVVNDRLKFTNHDDMYFRKIYGETRLHADSIYGTPIKDEGAWYVTENLEYGEQTYERQFAMVFSLNDDHDGGVFEFPYQDVSLKLKKGSVILFPPYWTHPHRVTDPNNTIRYTVNTWFCETNKR